MTAHRVLLALPLLATTLLAAGAFPGADAASVTVDLVASDEPRRAFYGNGAVNPTLTFASGDEVTVNVRFNGGTHNFRVLRPLDAVTPTRNAGTESLTFTIPADFTGTIAYLCDYHDDKMRGAIRVSGGSEGSEGSEGSGGSGGSESSDGNGGSDGSEGSEGNGNVTDGGSSETPHDDGENDGNVTEEETVAEEGSGGNSTDAGEVNGSGADTGDATGTGDGTVADDGGAGDGGALDESASAGGADTPGAGALAAVGACVLRALAGARARRRER